MQNKYIELKTRYNFGDAISTYFEFVKYNIKPFVNQYLRYNFISFILMLGCAYLLVTGFMGFASRDFRYGMSSDTEYTNYLVAGGIMLILVLFITYAINFSFASAYVSQYVNTKDNFTQTDVWKAIKTNIGNIILFMLLGIGIYIVYIIISLILTFIPVIGMFAQYGLSFLISTLFGFTFVSIFEENKSVGKALNEGWDFSIANFWMIVGYSFVIGILNMVLTLLVLSIPGFFFFIYMIFVVQSNVDVNQSVTASIVFTIAFSLFIITFTFAQALSQLSYGVLYYNFHEKKYNTYLQSKIDEIGKNE